jgi:hypothetical protein
MYSNQIHQPMTLASSYIQGAPTGATTVVNNFVPASAAATPTTAQPAGLASLLTSPLGLIGDSSASSLFSGFGSGLPTSLSLSSLMNGAGGAFGASSSAEMNGSEGILMTILARLLPWLFQNGGGSASTASNTSTDTTMAATSTTTAASTLFRHLWKKKTMTTMTITMRRRHRRLRPRAKAKQVVQLAPVLQVLPGLVDQQHLNDQPQPILLQQRGLLLRNRLCRVQGPQVVGHSQFNL